MNATAPSTVQDISQALQAVCPDASSGLGEHLFLAVSRLVPMVNVDLFVMDDERRVLLSWRHDQFYGPGWHVPGGVVRFKETLMQRVAVVAQQELGVAVIAEPHPLRVSEMFNANRETRGHFVSLAYRCRLASELLADLVTPDTAKAKPGQCAWFTEWPDEVISQHRVYRDLFTQLRTQPEH